MNAMSTRVIIGSSNEKIIKQLSLFLIENGLSVIGEATSGHDLLRKVHTVYPDLAIVDYKLKGMNGHELSEIIIGERLCPVIALISHGEIEHFINLSQEPTFVPLIKPCSKQMLMGTVDLLVKTSKSIELLEKQLDHLKTKTNTDAVIEKAKQLLIENMNLTEEEAHRRIQKQSMDKGISKIKIAEAIILMYD
jgi:response regulator NasT